MDRLRRWFGWWRQLRPGPFVWITVVLVFVVDAPITYGLEWAGISDEEVGYDKVENRSALELIVGAIVLAPLLETLLNQHLPFYLIRRYVRWRPEATAIVVSTLFFSLCHAVYSYWYALATLPSGLFLALTYSVFRHRKESAYWMTAAVHAATNCLSVALLLVERMA